MLCCVLVDPGQYQQVIGLGLRTEHLHHVAHREVYQAAGALWESRGFFDAAMLAGFLKEQGTLDVVGADYIAEILNAAATASSAPHYAEIVMRHAERREIVDAAEAVLEASRNGATNADVLTVATTRFTGIQQAFANRVRPVSAAQYLTTSVPNVEPIISGLLDKGDRHYIVSQSKAGKSWLALQQALCIAAGLSFLEWDVPEPKRVAVCQFELKESHYHSRVRRLAAALDLTPSDLGGRLDIFNLRGATFDIFDVATDYDVVVLDPLYVMLAHAGADENKATDVTQVLNRISAWQRQSEAAVVTVHHGTKGRIGDRQAIDRGAGSGAIGRDLDGQISLAPARDDPENCLVVDHTARNVRTVAPFVIEFYDGYFQIRTGIAPVAETSLTAANRQRSDNGPMPGEIADEVGASLLEPMKTNDLRTQLREKYGIGRPKISEVIDVLTGMGFARWKTKEFPCCGMIGPEEFRP